MCNCLDLCHEYQLASSCSTLAQHCLSICVSVLKFSSLPNLYDHHGFMNAASLASFVLLFNNKHCFLHKFSMCSPFFIIPLNCCLCSMRVSKLATLSCSTVRERHPVWHSVVFHLQFAQWVTFKEDMVH